jgi:hypothetical protein
MKPNAFVALGVTLACMAGVVAVFFTTCAGCSMGIAQMSDDWCGAHADAGPYRCADHNPSQSWDQANLKRNDHGCPTAIYIAPGGNLEQC